MLAIPFPGSRDLIGTIDRAIGQDSIAALTDCLRHDLCELIRAGQVQLPACVYEAAADRYARRELYRSGEHGYCVVAMTWGPGQGTPIHDHGGLWCVESVWSGTLEVTQYERVQHENDRYGFRPIGSLQAGVGSACSLAPPHEYHTTRNPSASILAVSLHVYADRLSRCAVFQPLTESRWYQHSERQLSLDPVH